MTDRMATFQVAFGAHAAAASSPAVAFALVLFVSLAFFLSMPSCSSVTATPPYFCLILDFHSAFFSLHPNFFLHFSVFKPMGFLFPLQFVLLPYWYTIFPRPETKMVGSTERAAEYVRTQSLGIALADLLYP